MRNVLLVLGAWLIAGLTAFILSFLIPVRSISFDGDIGAALLWVWFGIPRLLAAIVAAYTLLWVTETRRPFSWLLGLAALILYANGMNARKQLAVLRHVPPTVIDYLGVAIVAILPALACLLVGVWWRSRLADDHS